MADCKRAKLEHSPENIDESGDKPQLPLSNLESFEVQEVLNENLKSKTIFLRGKLSKRPENDAVLVLEKSPFFKDEISKIMTSETRLKNTLINNIYSNYDGYFSSELNGMKTSLIYPATQKHIDKYRKQNIFLVIESGEDYKNITLPHIESKQFSIEWVYNILEKKAEADRIVYEDPDPEKGFILLPDMKWDCKTVDNLYLVAIVHNRNIKSLRDLTADHLPLLRNIEDNVKVLCKDKYGVDPLKLRCYIHYQPSYYHFHVHVTHLEFEAPGTGVERAHLLSDVIDNIELKPDYYQVKKLSFTLKEDDELLAKLKDSVKV